MLVTQRWLVTYRVTIGGVAVSPDPTIFVNVPTSGASTAAQARGQDQIPPFWNVAANSTTGTPAVSAVVLSTAFDSTL